MDPRGRHLPVLLDEVLALLDPAPGQTLVDCTAGLGGHAAAIAQRLGPTGRVVLNDLDPNNLHSASARVRDALGPGAPPDRVVPIRGNFAGLPHELRARGLRADLVLADLGFASNQVDDPARGLSFMADGPLDMRLDPDGPFTARDLVNTWPEAELARVIAEFGEEREARRVARRIVDARAQAAIDTTARLAEIVRSVVRPERRTGGSPGLDPATRTFQALRIAVNDELGSLDGLLAAIGRAARAAASAGDGSWLRPGARVAVISFHSLEDRAVKHAFAELAGAGAADVRTRKVVEAGPEEQRVNPRSRSAKLRVVALAGGSAAGA